ncbi:leucine-rich repeat-containing protein 27-like [Cimex lectularius]|uniref:Leucine-rich repeat-containing protein 27 n=1 Tax=Cimex lectularius TaxID=79782 RepID=A0A8I6RBE2_CIMLE|nr:leucine-rich repeat-containing protein 27-like [Cimex lectularius]XP_014242084.1 leucine-rich repeat-containing protein 27-like [Cimex lectularius]
MKGARGSGDAKNTTSKPTAEKRGTADSQRDEKGQFRDKIWTHAEQKKYLQKLSTLGLQVEQEPRVASGVIEGRGNFLDLSGLNLKLFDVRDPNAKITLDNLSYLYLSNNQLERIPSELFAYCPNLIWLDLRRNLLKTFPTSVVNNASLETILLQRNGLKIIPLELGSLPNLKTLSVIENPLEFPNRTVLTTCSTDAKLIDYLRRCWENQSTKDVPILSPNKTEDEKKKKTVKRIQQEKKLRSLSEIVCEKKDSSKIIDQVVAEKITSELRSQEKTIQKAKDKETLRSWRDRKRRMERNEFRLPKPPPPFGVDPDAKMPSRRDLMSNLRIDMKGKPKRNSKDQVNLNREIEELRVSLQDMVKKRQTDDPHKEMSTRLNEIRAIKDIQRKLAALKKIS